MNFQQHLDLILSFLMSLTAAMSNGAHPDGEAAFLRASVAVLQVEAASAPFIVNAVGTQLEYQPSLTTTSFREHVQAIVGYLQVLSGVLSNAPGKGAELHIYALAFTLRAEALPQAVGVLPIAPTPPSF